ncbi:EAL domain-containing protein [Pseudolabrys taiwanensis]|uniref:EAL domain-containing protein n=1 Tax=Pseudolabrys taiwanensis TaxID=331696 RepID=A0A345ZR97_9HYPH|nr:EAL domain-containing protein [Pseudolabrys taiwanensis]AXK79444.1 EAL domain-containing protein [Pseudolabrys taiwanensis]
MARSHTTAERQSTNWDRARLSVVVPIGVIVAVAIVCIVVAVLSSAQRADEMAVDHERQLLSRAIGSYGERVLREVESVATSDAAIQNLRLGFDPNWARQRVGLWLETFFNHDYIFVFDGQDKPIYSLNGRRGFEPEWFEAAHNDLAAVLEFMRGRDPTLDGAIRLNETGVSAGGAHPQAAVIRLLLGRPAIIAAVAVGPIADIPPSFDTLAPIVMSVKFIDSDVLSNIASQLRMTNLRKVDPGPVAKDDFVYELVGPNGTQIARFAWTPKQPGAEIVNSVVPFIAVALAGFALLAAFVLRYMRRTAAAIATGETRLRHLAMHDPLCGLPNRIFFGERLEAVIEEVRGGGGTAAALYIDLDHFKEVNDTLGHHIGDELIRNVTLRLSHTLRGGDLVARLGGDEFAVISHVGPDHSKMMALAQRIISAICAPYSISGQNIVIGASVGIAVIDRNCGTATDIMRYADMALYRAKNEGRNRACIYDEAMDADLSNRKLLESDLRDALDNDALRVVYQPIVDKSGEKVLGVEALCRWTHPTRGEIPPSEFIPVAEHSGLIIQLGNWVLRRACLEGLAWPDLTVAVNVSPLQFRRSDFVDVVERILAETQFDPTRLELELTESVLLGNGDSTEAAMVRLKALGVRLALDDFGTGYSSLLYLRRYPFDKLKIDRSFVRFIEKAADAAAIVHAVVSLGRGLGMKVTAEGVETGDQHLFLRAAGVHSMQGYRFGRPCSAAEITARLEAPAAFKPVDVPEALAS